MIFNIRQVRTGRLYIQTLIALAAESVRLGRPRFKVRPKVHVLHCEILLRIESGARFNPRYASCFVEEDWVGQISAACLHCLKEMLGEVAVAVQLVSRG